MTFFSANTGISVGRTFQYSLMGEKWPGATPVITWSFAETPAYDQSLRQTYAGYPDFEQTFDSNQKQLIRHAFQAWEDVANIDFVEQVDFSAAKVRIGWDSIDGHYLSGGSFVGQAKVWWSESNNFFTQASIQIDLADSPEAYFGNDAPPANHWSFYATAAHEIGHALGLNHSSSSSDLMYATAGSGRVIQPSADDIAGLVALYGRHQNQPQATLVVNSIPDGIDTGMYRTANLDVAIAGIDPALHFATFGWREGRNPNAYFDVHFYLTANPDVSAADINPLEHYLHFGWQENRDTSSIFSTQGYLDANPDVKLAGINPLLHYLTFGYGEGRSLL